MQLDIHRGEECIVTISGELDRTHCPDLGMKIASLVAAGHRSIQLDFSQVTFLDSAGVGQLVNALTEVPRDVSVKIVKASRVVSRVFTVLGHAALVPPDEEEQRIQASRVLRRRLFDPYVRTA